MALDTKNKLKLGVFLLSVAICILTAILGELSLQLLVLVSVGILVIIYFFSEFEKSVLGLLIIRSSLDLFSAQQLPALYGVGIEFLAILFVIVLIITGHSIQTDKFWLFLMSWALFQSMWLILMLVGGLGFDDSYLSESIREWVRLLLWPTIYLLVMQLKGRVSPSRIISSMFFSLPIPLVVALYQIRSGELRVFSTFGHANAFATFLLLFIVLAWWKLNNTQGHKWLWIALISTLAFFLVSTKALFSLVMLSICMLVITISKVSPLKLISGLLLIVFVIGLFASSEFGQERLESVQKTPLGNPEITVSRAILNSEIDSNSFNWRLSQWHKVLKAWEKHPNFGYGLGLSMQSIDSKYLPHNEYIRAMVEGGIVGLGAFLTFFIALFLRTLNLYRSASDHKPRQDLCLSLSALIAATMIGMITENIWGHTVFLFYFFALLPITGWEWTDDSISSSKITSFP
ncbi:O-antigen ligase family protein [Acaryochloris sp. IP29b_bin.148]|uniref:O-antigen ligase family protein n=1 Tax=Acaryochloris sp. IP29b_bin.148 TaxID=2969218 RepID=UPI00260CDE08|nr:O-antigen ligase family protein [Acaryochloris sp. IP29b_bin.148]